MSKIERFKEIVAEMATLYENKNKDYGDSFGKSIKEHGYVAGIVRMEDKFNRLKNLLLSFEEPNFESISDTLTDLANYAIMMRMEIEDEDKADEKATQFERKVDADLSSLVGKIMTCPHKSLSEDGAEEINKALRQLLEDTEEAQKYFSESVSDLDEMKKNILKGLVDRFKGLTCKIFDDDVFCTIKF